MRSWLPRRSIELWVRVCRQDHWSEADERKKKEREAGHIKSFSGVVLSLRACSLDDAGPLLSVYPWPSYLLISPLLPSPNWPSVHPPASVRLPLCLSLATKKQQRSNLALSFLYSPRPDCAGDAARGTILIKSHTQLTRATISDWPFQIRDTNGTGRGTSLHFKTSCFGNIIFR